MKYLAFRRGISKTSYQHYMVKLVLQCKLTTLLWTFASQDCRKLDFTRRSKEHIFFECAYAAQASISKLRDASCASIGLNKGKYGRKSVEGHEAPPAVLLESKDTLLIRCKILLQLIWMLYIICGASNKRWGSCLDRVGYGTPARTVECVHWCNLYETFNVSV